MPADLMQLIENSFNAVNILQALIIAFVAALLMSRYTSVVFFSVLAIVIDQFVTIAFETETFWSDNTLGGVLEDLTGSFMALDATIVILRFIAYMVLITVIYATRSFFKKT